MAETARRAAYQLGLSAETRAALWLRLKGYRILARRHRTPLGEIDLIVRRGHVVAFVEVKARRDLAAALESLTPRTRRRIVEAAHLWLARRSLPPDAVLRFDVVAIAPWRRPRHIPDAWPSHR